MKKRTAKILKWFGTTVLALAVLHVVLLIAANHSLKKAYATLEADGRPMSTEDIIPAKIPDEDNAALLYKTAILRLKAEKAGNTNLWTALSEKAEKVLSTEAVKENLREFRELADNKIVAEALALVEQGTGKPGCCYDLKYGDQPMHLDISHSTDLLKVSKILSLTIKLQAEDNNFDGAWKNAVTALRLADALKNEPVLISQLVRAAQLKAAIISIQSLPYFPARYQEVDALLEGFDDPAPFVLGMDSERLLTGEWVYSLEKPYTWLEDGLNDMRAIHASGLLRPILKQDHATYLRIMTGVTRYLTEPYSQSTEAFDADVQETIPFYCLMSRVLTPALPVCKSHLSIMLARSRITRAGLAVLKHQAENEKWPETIPIQEELLDPFSDKPLIYKPTENGFTLSGIGQIEDFEKRIRAKDKVGISWEYSKPD